MNLSTKQRTYHDLLMANIKLLMLKKSIAAAFDSGYTPTIALEKQDKLFDKIAILHNSIDDLDDYHSFVRTTVDLITSS